MYFKSSIGIDPGITSGSFGFLHQHFGMILMSDMGKYDFDAIKKIVAEAPKPCLIALERSTASPQMGAVSAFNYGKSFGRMEAQLETLLNSDIKNRVQMVHLSPASWKTHCGLLKSSKNDSIRKARNLLSIPDKTPLDHHEAEAVLIAWTSLSWQK